MAYTTIDNPKEHFKSIIFTGDGSNARAITVGFEPDWTWMRQRTDASGGYLVDSIRGNNAALQSTNVNTEGTFANMTFTSTGITVTGNENLNNENAHNYVCWNWKGSDSSAASNTDGSIDSTVSANTTAGFSVVTYAGDSASSATVGHGLGVAPKAVIVKARNYAAGWPTQVDGAYGLRLNSTGANDTSNGNVFFANTAPTTSVFTVGGSDEVNDNYNYVAYCFADIKGYQQIGSFTGNANVAGNFVYTGFKPALLIFKNASDTREWGIIDNARSPHNRTLATLEPSKAAAENTSDNFDFYSNGFRAASTDPGSNGSGNTIIYIAIAENPFVSSKGIPTTAR